MSTTKLFLCCFVLASLLFVGCKKDIDYLKPALTLNSEKLGAVVLAAKKYFVSPAGNDSSDGLSIATAWKTIARVNTQVFAPGDQVLLEGGKTFTGLLYITNSGSSGQPIRFASYGTGKAVIYAGAGTGIYVYNSSFVIIDSLTIIGAWDAASQSGNTSYGIRFYTDVPGAVKLGEVAVSNCNVSKFQKSGISFLSYPADLSQSGYSKISVTRCNVFANGAAAISTQGPSASAGSNVYAFSYVYIALNKVFDNLGVKANTSSHSGDGILIGDAGSGLVENNVAYNNGWYNMAAAGGPAAIWCYDSKGIVFQYNEAHHNGTGAGKPDGDGFDLDGGAVNCIMQYNYSHDNYGAGYLLWEYGNTRTKNAGNILRYNISQKDNTNNNNSIYGAVSIGPNCSNNLVYNNSFWCDKGSAVFITGGKNNQFYNNILVTQTTAPVVTSTTTDCWFLNNDYYNSTALKIKFRNIVYSSLESFRATGNEIFNGINYGYSFNPLLSNPSTSVNINTGGPWVLGSFVLNAASPAINKGFNLTTWGFNVGTRDFKKFSVPFNGGYDLGACERH